MVLIAVAFTLMGALILQPQRLVPDGLELVSHQAAFLTGLAGWLKPLYDLAIFLAFFGILLGGPEMAYRLWSSYLDSLPALRRRINHRLLRAAAYGWTLIPALIILWTLRWLQQTGAVEPGFDLLDIVTPGRHLHQLRGQLLLLRQHLGRPQVSAPTPARSRFPPGRQPGGRQRLPLHRRQGHGKLPGGVGLRVPHPPAGRLHAGGPENAVSV